MRSINLIALFVLASVPCGTVQAQDYVPPVVPEVHALSLVHDAASFEVRHIATDTTGAPTYQVALHADDASSFVVDLGHINQAVTSCGEAIMNAGPAKKDALLLDCMQTTLQPYGFVVSELNENQAAEPNVP